MSSESADFESAFSGSESGESVDSRASVGDWECISYNPKLLTAVWLYLDCQSRFNLRCSSLELKEDIEDSISLELA